MRGDKVFYRNVAARTGMVVVLWGFCLWTNVADVRAEDADEATLHSGAWELGFNGSVVSSRGSTGSTIALFGNRFWELGGFPVSAGATTAFSHVADLDRWDVEASAAAYKRLSGISAYMYAGAGAGVRQEWIGSFSVVRYPVGGDLGLKALISSRAAITVTWQFRRLLNDPVEDFNEFRFVTGISILLSNGKE